MEEERLKMFSTPNVAHVAKGNRPEVIGAIKVGKLRKVLSPKKVG